MRTFALTAALAGIFAAAPVASAQFGVRKIQTPNIPIQQSSVPTSNPVQHSVTNPLQMTPGVNNVPGSMVYVPPRYVNYPGSTYIVNNYNNGTNNPYGYPSGGFNGYTASSGQFYAMMGGPAQGNPFLGNVPAIQPTWTNGTGVNASGQPWSYPFNSYNFNYLPQYPYLVNAPTVVGQANGFFPNQPPAIGQPAPKNNFGIQQVPGLNGR